MDTIAMDTYAFIPGGDVVVECVITRQDPALSPSARGQTAVPSGLPPAMVRQTTAERAAGAPLANVLSPRDNYPYRAAFTRPIRPMFLRLETCP